jgi:hypothetical protein
MTEKLENGGTGEKALASAKTRKASKPKKRKRNSRSRSAKGGRPAWSPSIEDRLAIEQMKFVGESENVIARALKIDVATLRKHCAEELKNGHANRRKEVIGLLFSAAKDGNVSAQRKLEEMSRVTGAAAALQDRAGGGGSVQEPVQAPKAAKLGKKEERKIAAQVVGAEGKFQPPAPPKLVVNNKT